VAKSYEEFFPYVLPDVAGCPEIAAIQAIRDSTIEFCEKSLIHQADHDPVTVTARIADYDLETPVSGTRITKVMKAWYKGQELIPAAPDQVRDPSVYNQRIGGYQTEYSTPRFFIQKDPDTFSLLPIPDQTLAQGITIRVALVPLRGSTSCENFLFEQWAETIGAGAVSRLQLVAAKPYSNPAAAAINKAVFNAGVNAARQKANRGYTRSSLSVQLRRI
jgi:hypothetical protein